MAGTLSHTQPQPTHRPALELVLPAQTPSRPRHHVRIERHARRLLDVDNFAGGAKALIDCLRQAGLIHDDDPGSIEIEFAQVKVAAQSAEGTRIVIRVIGQTEP